MKKMAVVALGGNALLRGDETGSIEQQFDHAVETCESIANLLNQFESVIITHGNGPVVGNIVLRNEAGNKIFGIEKMPLDICVADSQGGIGYLFERELKNVLRKRNISKSVISIITEVLVDANDPAFSNPTKPIGQYYTGEEAEQLSSNGKWVFKEDPRGRGWRRVVASPRPLEIFNQDIIHDLALQGRLVIASGGGGIPVIIKDDRICGVEAVIDKDLAGSLLAQKVHAEEFFILTDIRKAAINFNKPEQKFLDNITVAEAQRYYDEGHFHAGSMGPKILSAIEFIRAGGERAVITEASALNEPDSGTIITQ